MCKRVCKNVHFHWYRASKKLRICVIAEHAKIAANPHEYKKNPQSLGLRVSCQMARREGFEPPAFWSVGCLKHKSKPFRLRFVFFTTVRSADFPLFPSSPARSGSVLGQKWVKDRCMAGEFEQSVRIHTERLIGPQLFLPEGLCINDLVVWKCLGQNLQH